MRWQTKVKPPDRERYLERCRALEKCLKHVDVMPPFLTAANCWFVLKQACGGKWRAVLWILLNIAHDAKGRWQERVWLTWHLYVRLRSWAEIEELEDQYLEELTGEDHREWPEVITVEESEIR